MPIGVTPKNQRAGTNEYDLKVVDASGVAGRADVIASEDAAAGARTTIQRYAGIFACNYVTLWTSLA
jgi:hypothetical protein